MHWEEYVNWLKENSTFECTQENRDVLCFHNGNLTGKVQHYPQEIIELSITDEKEETLFYLHFQLKDALHAQELGKEMLVSLFSLSQRHGLRILLSCSSALTTSYFAQQLNNAAALLKMDYSFEAVSYDHLYEKGFDYDVILLAPQIGFEYKKAKDIFLNQLVLKIPGSVFAQYNTGEMLQIIKHEYDKKQNTSVPEENLSLRSAFNNPYRILTIAVINHLDGNCFAYRIYDHGRMTLNKEVIKKDILPSDIFDLLDYIFARHKNIDYIGISFPGIINHGNVHLPERGFHDINLSLEIYKKYHTHSTILNDANALALGYHAMHEDFDNMAFLFMPRGLPGGGLGIIINGKLHRGYKHNAGEIIGLTDMLYPDAAEIAGTPEGALKLVMTSMLACITTVAPEKIVYYSDLTPNEEVIHRELEKYIQSSYIPELIHVNQLKQYQLPGTMIRCLEVMKYDEEHPGWWDHILDKHAL